MQDISIASYMLQGRRCALAYAYMKSIYSGIRKKTGIKEGKPIAGMYMFLERGQGSDQSKSASESGRGGASESCVAVVRLGRG